MHVRSIYYLHVGTTEKQLLESELHSLEPGDYWYDTFCGSWGLMNGPAVGRINASLPLGGGEMARDCSGGDTGIFLNNRELHELDYSALAAMGVVLSAGEWWADADGNIGQKDNAAPSFNIFTGVQPDPTPFYPPPLHGSLYPPAASYTSYPSGGYPPPSGGYPPPSGYPGAAGYPGGGGYPVSSPTSPPPGELSGSDPHSPSYPHVPFYPPAPAYDSGGYGSGHGSYNSGTAPDGYPPQFSPSHAPPPSDSTQGPAPSYGAPPPGYHPPPS
eukprot:TRINITY_DN4232_c0_g1_i2.p1 TRINITY_DN4232_c0_g1~~TRINITY_DN4232_c0_g1_i2.p1  ORF type:complete len:272 (-),score=23.77 TRINITY_DN4232_c0_g1_i2:180-995(-)